MLLLSHIGNHVINLFFIFYFLYLNFSSPHLKKKKTNKQTNKQTLPLPISSHTYYYTSSNLSFFFFFFFTSLSPHYFTVILLSSFYILTILLPILFCINLLSFSHSIHNFLTQNYKYSLSLSLSLSLGEFLFFLITLIKG